MNQNLKYTKLISTMVLAVFISLVVSSCQPAEPIYKPGTYFNQAEGYYSTILVQVTVDAYNITDIFILEHEEPKILSDIVFEELPPRIIKKNSTDIDGISGATYTSSALLEAVEEALRQAREEK